MEVEIKNLKTVANYAKLINKSVGWVYKLIDAKKVECVIIDGVKFIKIK